MEEHGRLRHLGFLQLLVRSCKHDTGYLEAKNLVCLVEKFFCQRVVLIEFLAHADKLRSLSWEYKCFHLLSIV